MSDPLACVICGRVPAPAFPDRKLSGSVEPAQPYGATTFVACGQYGSTVFDPSDGHPTGTYGAYLELNICDKCLMLAAGCGQVVLVTKETKAERKYQPWEGR